MSELDKCCMCAGTNLEYCCDCLAIQSKTEPFSAELERLKQQVKDLSESGKVIAGALELVQAENARMREALEAIDFNVLAKCASLAIREHDAVLQNELSVILAHFHIVGSMVNDDIENDVDFNTVAKQALKGEG